MQLQPLNWLVMDNQNENIEILSDIIGFGGEYDTRTKKLVVTNEMLDRFVKVSGDDNPIHTDDNEAKRVGFDKGRIAHGGLISGLMFSALVEFFGHNLDIRRLHIKFSKPVYANKEIAIDLARERGNDGIVPKIEFKVKSEGIDCTEGQVVYHISQSNCDKTTLEKALAIGWLSTEVLWMLEEGVVLTDLTINFTNSGISKDPPNFSFALLKTEKINARTQKTYSFSARYGWGPEVIFGEMDISIAARLAEA